MRAALRMLRPLKLGILSIALLSAVCRVASADGDVPYQTLRWYFDALRIGDRATANQLTASFPKFGKEQVAAVTDRFVRMFARPGFAITVRDGKVTKDCAVVICYESQADPDPAYLIRQAGEWKVLPKLAEFDRGEFEFSAPIKAQFEELETWYLTQVNKLVEPATAAFRDASFTRPEVLAQLLDDGLDPNTRSKDAYEEPLLWRAVRNKQLAAVRLLLDRGANVDGLSANFKKTPLFQAAYAGELQIATLLLDRGADPNALDINANNALREAILDKNVKMVRLLLDRGCNPNQVNVHGDSMRALAKEYSSSEVQALLAGATGEK